jgi:CBS domain-containing protein
VDEIVKPCSEANTVGPDSDVMEILSKMGETGASRLMVTDRDHLLAIVSQGDLIELLAARLIAQRGPSRLRCASH